MDVAARFATLGVILSSAAACGGPEVGVPATHPTSAPAASAKAAPATSATATVTALAPEPAARGQAQLVLQRAPAGGLGASLAVGPNGLAATWTDDDVLRLWHLPSRTLLRAASEQELGGRLVHPVQLAFDVSSGEVLVLRGADAIAIGVEGPPKPRTWPQSNVLVAAGGTTARFLSSQYGKWRLVDGAGKTVREISGAAIAGADATTAANGAVAIFGGKVGLVHVRLDGTADATAITLPAKPLAASAVAPSSTLALSADGETAWACAKTGSAHRVFVVRNLSRGALVQTIELAHASCAVAATAEGAVVVAGDEALGLDGAGAVRWRTRRAETTTALGANGDGRSAVLLGYGGSVELIDARTGTSLGELGDRVSMPVALAFAGDRLVASRTIPSIFTAVSHVVSWSPVDGTLGQAADVDWGSWFSIADDATLHAARSASKGCADGKAGLAFSVGAVSKGAPAGTPAPNAWPPAPGKDTLVCLPAKSAIEAVSPHVGRAVLETPPAAPRVKPGHAVIDSTGAVRPLADVPGGGIGGTMLWFSRDGGWILSAPGVRGAWSELHVWDAKTGAKVGVLTADPADPKGIVVGGGPQRKGYSVEAFSDDGRAIAVAGDDSVTVYELPSRRAKKTLRLPGGSYSTALSFARGSTSRVFVGTADGRLLVSSEEGATFAAEGRSSGGGIRAAVVRRDNARAATISDDGALRIWETTTARELAALVEFADGESLAITPRGAYAGTVEAADRVRWVFDAPAEGFSFERFAGTFARPEVVAKRLSTAEGDVAATVARPPRIGFASPLPATASGASVRATLRVSSAASKVAALQAFVEGRPVARQAVGQASAEVALDVPLTGGDSSVSFVAFDDAGAASNALVARVSSPAAAARPDVWIVAAGVGRYERLGPGQQLEAAPNDARAIAAAFEAQAGAGKTFAAARSKVLVDAEATPASIEAALGGLAAMKPADLAVVLLAGHGIKPKGEDMVFLTGQAALTREGIAGASIGWRAIGSALEKARGRVLVLLDACHSGHVSQDLVAPNGALASALVGRDRAGVVVFAASKGRQLSYETGTSRALVLDAPSQALVAPPPAGAGAPAGHGYFTGAVLASLASAATDVDRDGRIELGELVDQVSVRVAKVSQGKQTPWVVRRELFGDFAVARAPVK